MELITDFATPVELTGAARASLADYEAANGTLAQFLPNITSESRIAKFSIAATGLAEAADYRSWDAEASIGFGAEGDGSGLAELPPVSQKLRISELDTVDSSVASAPEWKRNIAVKKAAEASRAIADRVEFARGQALQNGKVVSTKRTGSKVTSQPVSKVVVQGTKPKPAPKPVSEGAAPARPPVRTGSK